MPDAHQRELAAQLQDFVDQIHAGEIEITDDHLGGSRPMFNRPGVLRVEFRRIWQTRTDLDC